MTDRGDAAALGHVAADGADRPRRRTAATDRGDGPRRRRGQRIDRGGSDRGVRWSGENVPPAGRAWEHWFVPETVGQLAWTLSADQSEVSISHTVEGRVGWMAVGLRNPTGKKNGMNGAPVVMTIPDADEAEGFGRSAVDAYRLRRPEAGRHGAG